MRIGFVLVLVLLISISSAQNDSTMYKDNGISFEIPQNWNVVKDIQDGNDTQIVLSDNISAIRIDLIKYSDKGIDKLMFDHLVREKAISEEYSSSCNCPWRLIYGLVPWQANGAIGYYYKNDVIKSVNNLKCSGSGISIKPDGVDQASIYESCEEAPSEWLIAWIKPEYKEEFIGVHALFLGSYPQIPFEWRGSPKNYTMQQPLRLILTTITKGDNPKSTSLTELV